MGRLWAVPYPLTACMMRLVSYLEQWSALSARSDGVVRASAALRADDAHGAWKQLGAICAETFGALKIFAADFKGSLPPAVTALVEEYAGTNKGKVIENAKSDAAQMRAAVVYLVMLQSEIAYFLDDRQELLRSRTERALLHLQRVLAVDADARERWLAAFAERETACEKLGATHLLYHGIYAFKVDGGGGRTDLVFEEPVASGLDARGIEGMVLTEWKLAADEKIAVSAFETARTQADLYKDGPLAGLELAAYRYLIVVTRAPLSAVPSDIVEGGVTYRHINVVIEPPAPSRQARQKGGA